MMRRPPLVVLLASLAALLTLAAPPGGVLAARPAKKPRHPRATTFEVCRDGCRYRTIQKAVDAAGAYAGKHRGAKATVAIEPGRYVEGVIVDGDRQRADFDGLTIEGTGPEPGRTVLEGRGARGSLAAAQDGIEATDVDGLTLRNIWARNFESDGFLVHASPDAGGHCDGFTMDGLRASGNGADGLAARGCTGGRITGSVAYRQGDSGLSIAETPCDSPRWSVYGGAPCQASPRWTVLRDDESYENAAGYSGPNAKYVQIVEDAFFDDGTGIVANSVEGLRFEPNGWNVIERNDVFWNNYDPHLAEAGLPIAPEVSLGLGTLNGRTLDYPTGVGIVLSGSDGSVVLGNHVFGNYKWGIASFSLSGETLVADEGNEARNVDNEIAGNFLGRGGADPNGEFDIWNDATGGGNCWGANSPNSTFAPGNGKLPPTQIYPVCPQAQAAYATAKSLNLTAGLQTSSIEPTSPATILGYASTEPPQDQQCSWVRRAIPHPPFQRFTPIEVGAQPGEVNCERR